MLGGDAVVGVSGVLECDCADALLRQGSQHEVEPLGEPGANDDPLGIGDCAADATKVSRDHFA